MTDTTNKTTIYGKSPMDRFISQYIQESPETANRSVVTVCHVSALHLRFPCTPIENISQSPSII